MNQWLWKHLLAAGYDVSAALNACVDDIDQLDPADLRKVVRTGLRALLAEMAKKQKLLIPNGHPTQLPLFATVKDGERWVRVSYLLADLNQLTQLFGREKARHTRTSDRLERMRADLEMYRKHPELPSLEAVWQREGVTYRVENAA